MKSSRILDHNGTPYRMSSGLGPSYEAASTGRRMSTWGTSNAGPNDSVISGLSNVRSRARELERNNPWIDGGVDTFIAYLVGTSISPRWKIGDKTLKEEVQGLWAESVNEMDYDGVGSFYSLQGLVSRSLVVAGECLYRKRVMPLSDDYLVPLQIEVIEPDHLDHAMCELAPNGNEIRFGVEFDSIEKRAAYWLFREHPGESYGFLKNYMGMRVRVPASDIGHVFRRFRPKQERGISWLRSVIARIYELDKCEDGELVRRTMAGMYGGFVIKPATDDSYPMLGEEIGRDANNNRIVAMEPGTWPELPPGYDVKFASPPDAGEGFFDLTKHHLRAVAKGTRNTYENITGDLSGVNFSSIRAGRDTFLELIEQIQHHTLIYQLCRPVAMLWMDLAVASGRLKIRDYAENKRAYQRMDWVPDAPPYVNPLQDVQADILKVRAGFTSRAQIVAKRGGDIEKVDAEIEEENLRADEKGFAFDTDPRRTAQSGSIQDFEGNGNGPEPK